jgi:hypothetical protein
MIYFIHTLWINLSTEDLNLDLLAFMHYFLFNSVLFFMTDVDNLVRMATRFEAGWDRFKFKWMT